MENFLSVTIEMCAEIHTTCWLECKWLIILKKYLESRNPCLYANFGTNTCSNGQNCMFSQHTCKLFIYWNI